MSGFSRQCSERSRSAHVESSANTTKPGSDPGLSYCAEDALLGFGFFEDDDGAAVIRLERDLELLARVELLLWNREAEHERSAHLLSGKNLGFRQDRRDGMRAE